MVNIYDKVGGIDAYNLTLTRSNVMYGGYTYANRGAASLSDCALINITGNGTIKINSSLTRTNERITYVSNAQCFESNGKYVIAQDSSSTQTLSVDSSLTSSTIGTDGVNGIRFISSQPPASVNFNNNAIFAGGGDQDGGEYDSFSNLAKRWDQSLTRSNIPNLSTRKHGMGSAANKSYAIFATGYAPYGQDFKFNCYNKSYTSIDITNPYSSVVSSVVYSQFAVGKDDNTLFAGGYYGTSPYILNCVFDITSSLTVMQLENLTLRRYPYGGQSSGCKSGSIGKYFLITGGAQNVNVTSSDSNFTNTVEVYEVA